MMKAIRDGLQLAITLGIAMFLFDIAWVYATPAKNYFYYETIVPFEVKANHSPKFISVNSIRKLNRLTSQEEVVCQYEDGTTEQFGERLIGFTPKAIQPVPTPGNIWVLDTATLPNAPAICHLEANVQMQVKYGIVKQQLVISEYFEIEP